MVIFTLSYADYFTRVRLRPTPDSMEGSDYINASFIDVRVYLVVIMLVPII